MMRWGAAGVGPTAFRLDFRFAVVPISVPRSAGNATMVR
jgi:hypothetical protein